MMKRVIPNGTAIKQLREQLERLSTQKELANAISVSIRMLRKIENANQPISVILLDRIAKLLGVHREVLMLPSPSISTASAPTVFDKVVADLGKEQLIPRHDWEYASATADETKLYDEAASSHDLACKVELPLTEETGAYAQELIDILTGLTWRQRDTRVDIAPSEQIAVRRRIRQLIVLLRGNDIWIYQTKVLRRLPERYDLPPEDEPSTMEMRYVVALGAPAEYGEDTMRVPIDHGQPFILPAWKSFVTKQAAVSC